MPENKAKYSYESGYLKCLIYDLYALATAIDELKQTEDYALKEVYKTAGLVKLRAIHDFFFRPEANTIKLSMFDHFNPKKPENNALKKCDWLTLESINTYVAHLDKRRITKVYEKK